MKPQPTAVTSPTRTVTVLSVSPLPQDHFSLQEVFNHSKWTLYKTDRLASAMAIIHRREIGVVICERDESPGTWIDMLEELRPLQGAPPLIVTSRLADERLWAEALNLGAYDVLATPLERREVIRSVSSAWLRWHYQLEVYSRGVIAMKAAG